MIESTVRPSAAVAALLALTACIPVRLPRRPAVSGIVYATDTTRGGSARALAGVPIVLSETRPDSSCRNVAARTVTDADGRFAFPRRKAWGIVPLIGIADGFFAWHLCAPAGAGREVAPAYSGSHFGGPAAPPADTVRCVAESVPTPGERMRCTSVTAATPRVRRQ